MTSNLGSQDVRELGEGATDDEVRTIVMNAVSQHFRPEFINRIDELVIFHSLKSTDSWHCRYSVGPLTLTTC